MRNLARLEEEGGSTLSPLADDGEPARVSVCFSLSSSEKCRAKLSESGTVSAFILQEVSNQFHFKFYNWKFNF